MFSVDVEWLLQVKQFSSYKKVYVYTYEYTRYKIYFNLLEKNNNVFLQN